MKSLLGFCFSVLLLCACANKAEQKLESYIGVDIPDFENAAVDTLVKVYETDRNIFYKAQENADLQSYYLSKQGNPYNPSGFYDQTLDLLKSDGDQKEIEKFQKYISQSAIKVREFRKKLDQKSN